MINLTVGKRSDNGRWWYRPTADLQNTYARRRDAVEALISYVNPEG